MTLSTSISNHVNPLSLGKWGERVAEHYLQTRGLQVLARNWRHGRLGEVDLVMMTPDPPLLVFVEVKTRLGKTALENAAAAVTLAKQQQLCQLAEAYCVEKQLSTYPIRFDVVCISPKRSSKNNAPGGFCSDEADIQHFPGAFNA